MKKIIVSIIFLSHISSMSSSDTKQVHPVNAKPAHPVNKVKIAEARTKKDITLDNHRTIPSQKVRVNQKGKSSSSGALPKQKKTQTPNQ